MDRVGEDGSWAEALASVLGPGRAGLAAAFSAAVPAGYREQVGPEDAAFDLDSVVLLEGEATAGTGIGYRFGVRPDIGAASGSFRLRRVALEPVELSALLPLLESFGLAVIEAVPQWIEARPGSAHRWHVDDIGVRLRVPLPGPGPGFDLGADGDRLLDALRAGVSGAADVDSLNRLVLSAGMGWHQVVVVRAYRRYLHQAASRWSGVELEDALAGYPKAAEALVGYFEARFDPDGERTATAVESALKRLLSALSDVTHLQADQILRLFVALVDATTRTNAFTDPSPFGPDRALAIQLESARVPDLPAPRPHLETFAHGPTVEGIHLRNGLIARGGLRWSDRPDDLRTEVLDLAQAQVKKNAIIVPTGAKGGFVVRGARAGQNPGPVAVRAAYETFVGSLLDITDNVVGGEVVHPVGVVAPGEDPYLVVAADRGTATFSDLANAISERRSFWLGDAFASGGSQGYDHKALGITARGAWVAVRRHFHQLGVDPQSEAVRVVGVGDMSGDVFGNGMLMSETIRLVAAFDHRHVFIDPDPDPAASYAERRRLAGLARSSWDDWDRSILSRGGGIWSRNAKAIELSPAAGRALGVEGGVMTPPQLISAILAAPVDLVWFGGIGTYVRSPDESDADVGDRANDGVRITSNQLRARVVAEGGNLAVTQRGRIRFSRRGGRINTDFIDNAAGVATSDREVNIKILLGLAIEAGTLRRDQRDALLAEVTADVVTSVLAQVDHSVVALARAVTTSAIDLDAYEALIEALESAGLVDRHVESLPDTEELSTRRQAGAGLIRPELAVLLAYAKSALVADIEASGLPGEPALIDSVAPYFPTAIRDRCPGLIGRHRLYPQLVATDVAGEVVDQMGITWAHEIAAALHRSTVDVAAAFWAARQVLDAGSRWQEVAVSAAGVFDPGADLDLEAHRVVAAGVDVVARRYLARSGPIRPGTIIDQDRQVAARLVAGPLREPARAERDRLVGLGADPAMAASLARWASGIDVADVAAICRRAQADPVEVADVLIALDQAARLAMLFSAARRAGRQGRRWSAWQAEALVGDLRSWRAAAAGVLLAGGGGIEAALESVASWRAEGAFTAVDMLSAQLGSLDDLTVVALIVRAMPVLS